MEEHGLQCPSSSGTLKIDGKKTEKTTYAAFHTFKWNEKPKERSQLRRLEYDWTVGRLMVKDGTMKNCGPLQVYNEAWMYPIRSIVSRNGRLGWSCIISSVGDDR